MTNYSLYLITDSGLSRGRNATQIVEAAVRGGVTMVQYREKRASTKQMIQEASELRDICGALHVTFIVNDRVDVALAVDADGVHVGQDDMPAALARRLLGGGRILGVSVENTEQAIRAVSQGADYLGASPVFSTPTKPDTAPPLGIDGLHRIAGVVAIPVVAIGGVNTANAATLIGAGAAGVAVVSAIVLADDVESAARTLRRIVDNARSKT